MMSKSNNYGINVINKLNFCGIIHFLLSSMLCAMDKPLPLILVTPHSTPHQRNCFFLAAVYNAKTNPTENHLFIKKSFEEEKNHNFSCYMSRLRQDPSQEGESFKELESHINPLYIVEHNKDQRTRNLLQHYGYVQKPVIGVICYFPSPLLWACIGNNIEQAKTALMNTQELEKLSKDSEQIVDCVHVAMQHCNTALADLLLKHPKVGTIYFSCGSSRSPRAQHDDTTEKKTLPFPHKKNNRSSATKQKKNKSNKTI